MRIALITWLVPFTRHTIDSREKPEAEKSNRGDLAAVCQIATGVVFVRQTSGKRRPPFYAD